MTLRACLIGALAMAAFALFAAPSAHAAPGLVAGSCSVHGADVDCGAWHDAPVTLSWSWSAGATQTMGCDVRTFSSDTPPAGTGVTCTVWWGADFAGKTETVRVDTTPPAVTSATAARGPDQGGWYNQPVAFVFHGSDATSGIASCDTVTFAGPDGSPTAVTGGCTDLAGNRGLASFPLFYDDTSPPPPSVNESVGNRSVTLSWAMPPGATSVSVDRVAGAKAAKVIYRGTGNRFTDRHLRNGVRYRYTITVFDQAGNTTVKRVTATPTSSPFRPLGGTVVQTPPRLTWKRARGADYYNVQLFRRGKKLLSAWPHGAHLQLRQSWKYRGRQRHLKPGLYRWYVWPGYGKRAAHSYGERLGGSSFRVR
jgi:hypothetical protein